MAATKTKNYHPKLVFNQDKKGRWRWTVIAHNGKKIFNSSEGDGFPSLRNAKLNWKAAVAALIHLDAVTAHDLSPDEGYCEIIHHKKK